MFDLTQSASDGQENVQAYNAPNNHIMDETISLFTISSIPKLSSNSSKIFGNDACVHPLGDGMPYSIFRAMQQQT